EPDRAAPGPPCSTWRHMQSLAFKRDKQRMRRARLKELPTSQPAEAIFSLQCEGGRMADHEHVELKAFGSKGISGCQRQINAAAFHGHIADAFEEALNQTHWAMAADAEDDRDEDDLARNLRLNGAGDVLVRRAKHLRCATWSRTKHASSSHRVSRMSPVVGSNGAFGVDGLHLQNARGKPYLFPSIVEASATYHVARYLKYRKPATVAKVFRELRPAGSPNVARLGPGGAFYAEFRQAMDMLGIRAKAAAEQSQRQNGRTERRGGWLKLMINR
ncbi:unnamed protein product, partial [Prorocentrum cordatum]